jgi:hypothetical protein
MTLNVIGVIVFGYLLLKTDYTIRAKWMYYMDGFVFAINFAMILMYITNMIEV